MNLRLSFPRMRHVGGEKLKRYSFIFITKHNFSLIHLISGLVFDVESKCLCLHWELISLTTLFHVQIRIYMNITQSERDIVKCVCKSMYLATSPATR